MITSKELMKAAESRGVRLTYDGLRKAMADLRIRFKGRKIDGHIILSYLTSRDVRSIGKHLGIRFDKPAK